MKYKNPQKSSYEKKNIIIIAVIFIIVFLVSSDYLGARAEIYVASECGEITKNTILNSTISNNEQTNCLTINMPNRILDCDGNEIRINQVNLTGIHSAVFINKSAHHTTIRNCRILGFNETSEYDVHGITSYGSNNLFLNNIINLSTSGL